MTLYTQAEKLDLYLQEHSSPEDPVLQELARHTYLKEVHPRMLSGHVLGSFLSLFSQMHAPSRILEIGTYTGYSAICLAKGLKEGGRLITIEANDELKSTALKFFKKAGLEEKIQLINGNALDILPGISGDFDLVFIDANKEEYSNYFELVIDKVKVGGYILADNVLWGGKVISDHKEDAATRAIHEFNQMLTDNQNVENLLLPVRDGLMIVKKK